MTGRRLDPRRRWVSRAGLAVGLLGVLTAAGCASGHNANSARTAGPNWAPQPAYTLEPAQPNTQSGSGNSATPTPSTSPAPSGGGGPAPSESPSGGDSSVVATNLSAPVGIAVLPDGSALVGQRTTGVIVQVQSTAGQPVTTVRTIPGLDVSGDGGLLDLALSPEYGENHLIYAYVTTPTDNRVVDFTLTGPITPVFTGIPRAATGNRGRIAFTADGNLLIGTGDAGQPALAQNPASLAGKVLEVNDVGQSLTAGSPVLAQGLQGASGLCVDPDTGSIFETEPAAAAASATPAAKDEVNLIAAGQDYGWPVATARSVAALTTLPLAANGSPANDSGCAVSNGTLVVASLDSTSLYTSDITSPTGATNAGVTLDPFVASLTGHYGRLITVVADPDGTLWLATSNGGIVPAPAGASSATDERILHIQPTGGGAGSKL